MINKQQILADAVYSTEEAAELLGLNQLTIQKYIREKKIEAVLIGGKWYRVPGKSLLKFLDESKTLSLFPNSFKLKDEDIWIARIDVVEDLGDTLDVKGWTWHKKKFSSKEAADHYSRLQAKRKLIGITK